MNFADVSAGEWIVIVLGILLSIILISGHGKWFIAGYNTSSAEERKDITLKIVQNGRCWNGCYSCSDYDSSIV